jgi:predicted adenine nucleotide alpha hydrolase (AANH) superfamily ATPase
MEILLHTCCAPCLIYPLKRLKEKGFAVKALFYNPNIHPLAEYDNRKRWVEYYSKNAGLEVIYLDYDPAEYFRAVNMIEERIGRCPICWYQRLKITARIAAEKGFTHFSSTLLASPYQDIELIQKIGSDLAKAAGAEFYFEDFRPGFKDAHSQAKAQGIYCQKYCGCIYSEVERQVKKAYLS